MPSPAPASESDPAIAAAAAAWVARRDRGLSPAEQDAFLQWLREDSRHRTELARLERAWGALDTLTEWRPAHSDRPNPDLLAGGPGRQRRLRPWMYGALTAAASLTLAFLWWQSPPPPPASPATGLSVIPAPERVLLEDGTVVEANRGGEFSLAFSPAERRVRLTSGEAHFTVAKNPARPFVVVTANGVQVRALGTAFNVRCAAQSVDVLVTEGRVEVDSPAPPRSAARPAPALPLQAGQQATVDISHPTAPPTVVNLSQAQIDHALAWQGVRLAFDELPLSAVIAEFNLRNRQQLEIADPRIAGLRVAGSFRADNVEAFARLLEASFGVAATRRPDGSIVLRRAE